MVANAALHQQAIDSESVGSLTRRRLVRRRLRLCFGFLQHRDQVAADHPPGLQLRRRMVGKPRDATRQATRGNEVPLLPLTRVRNIQPGERG
jgi:hypothetical protein